MNDPAKPFSVLLFGSHPDADNDDCWTGDEFATEAEARACLADPWGPDHFDGAYYNSSTAFFLLEGPMGGSLREIVANPGYRPRRRDDAEWRSEIAMQAGMGGGCDAYNEMMGY